MKYKILLSLLVVSVSACSRESGEAIPRESTVADEKKEKAVTKVVKTDLDALEESLKGKTKEQVKEIMGAPPTKDERGSYISYWYYDWTFVDEVSEATFHRLKIAFSTSGDKRAFSFRWKR